MLCPLYISTTPKRETRSISFFDINKQTKEPDIIRSGPARLKKVTKYNNTTTKTKTKVLYI